MCTSSERTGPRKFELGLVAANLLRTTLIGGVIKGYFLLISWGGSETTGEDDN